MEEKVKTIWNSTYIDYAIDEHHTDAAFAFYNAEVKDWEQLYKNKKQEEQHERQRKGLPELHGGRRNNKELLLNTARKVFGMFGLREG